MKRILNYDNSNKIYDKIVNAVIQISEKNSKRLIELQIKNLIFI